MFPAYNAPITPRNTLKHRSFQPFSVVPSALPPTGGNRYRLRNTVYLRRYLRTAVTARSR